MSTLDYTRGGAQAAEWQGRDTRPAFTEAGRYVEAYKAAYADQWATMLERYFPHEVRS